MTTPVKISEAASIALHACLWLSRDPGAFHPVREICAALDCSHAHMSKVMQDLCRARLIESQRGPAGGVRLANPPQQTTLLAVYEAVEGAIRTDSACLLLTSICPGRNCFLGKAIAHLNSQFIALLTDTVLTDINLPIQKGEAHEEKHHHH